MPMRREKPGSPVRAWRRLAVPASGDTRPFQADPARPDAAVQAGLGFVAEGAGMLLLEPAMFCADILLALKNACTVPLAPFSVSGEYTRLASGDGDWRLLAELFIMLKRADQPDHHLRSRRPRGGLG